MERIFQYSLINQLPIIIIYHKGLEISQRKILVKEINNRNIKAYCYLRRSIRNFSYDNILSVAQINSTEVGLYSDQHREASNHRYN
ncbi:hypothetical protein [Alkaliphilus serpentinus]|uniref:hypothetical protein n=1 Tax=Alkaliphilus serpentinus TaxID=1482731 RepID=UPI00186579A7|nr:hypothetical protein [Alkaliphilus serpentinus]